MPELFIARQPIYNRTQHVYGYELLYRASHDNFADEPDPDMATSQVIINALGEIGYENLVGSRLAFINLSRNFVVGKYPVPLPPKRVVIEVSDHIADDDEAMAGIAWFASQGFTIAIDKFVYQSRSAKLLELVNIIKVDVQTLREDELQAHVIALKKFPHLKLLAERVEIYEEYEMCRELGFDYFQGHFFARPKMVRRTRMPANQISLMKLLAELQDPDVKVAKLEKLISNDVGLSYKLLRYINSAFFGLPKQMESIQRAVVFLGTEVIKKWATLLVLARVEDKPTELMVTAVIRAKMCEMLAKAKGSENEDICFTVGLLSVLEALLDMPMEKVLAMLTLSHDVNRALLRQEGEAGELLSLALHYEFNEWDQLAHPDIDEDTVMDAYLQAVAWASEACAVLLGDN